MCNHIFSKYTQIYIHYNLYTKIIYHIDALDKEFLHVTWKVYQQIC